jgi:phosphoribosylanthranilate isomerase
MRLVCGVQDEKAAAAALALGDFSVGFSHHS